MKYRRIIYVLVLGFMFSCANEKTSNNERSILKESILDAYKNFDESFSMKRSPPLFVGGGAVDNCKSYFDMAGVLSI